MIQFKPPVTDVSIGWDDKYATISITFGNKTESKQINSDLFDQMCRDLEIYSTEGVVNNMKQVLEYFAIQDQYVDYEEVNM